MKSSRLMFGVISTHLRKLSTGPVTVAALIIFILFTALVLPAQSAKSDDVSGEVATPDLSLFYTPDELYHMAEAYGEEGRVAYIRARFTFDIAWPLVYTFFLVTAISWLFGRGFSPTSRWQIANLAPVLAALLDFLENLSTSLVMARYPLSTPLAAIPAPFFTFFKWVWVGLSFLLLLVGAAAVVWRWVSGKRAGAKA